jgi:phage recombination protein Bet
MSTQAIEISSRTPLAVTPEQVAIARNTVAKGLNDDQFAVYLYNCQRQGIHPLDGLIIPIVRTDNGQERLTFVTTVDLLRSRAAETNEYAGSDDAIFEYVDPKVPSSATVTVWRFVQGQKCSFTATARYEEYYPGDGKQGFMWRSKPHVMLGKCAEGLALRKSFPKQLAGLYLEEELQQAPSLAKPKKEVPKPVGSVKCGECGAEGGHLPKCSKRQKPADPQAQAPAKPEAVMCGRCGKMNGHEPSCPDATPQTAEPSKSGLSRAVVLILSVESKLKAADKSGKREPFKKLHVVSNANEEFDLFVWHQTPQEFLTEKVVDKNMLCEFTTGTRKDNSKYYSLETIIELAGVQFVNNKPQGEMPAEDF